MLVVAALGGNALLRRGEPLDARTQERNVRGAVAALAEVASEHRLVITHGNGPQVGQLAVQAAGSAHPYPLDVLGAQTEGMIGYLIERELRGLLPGASIAALLTQVEVDADDPAFDEPTKPIGPVYEKRTEIDAELGWVLKPDTGGWRRVVASPQPQRILELPAIRTLVEAGTIVICAGGGGIPVVTAVGDAWRGVEAVVDKDLAAVLLATELGADALLLLTDVEGIFDGWGTDQARPLRHVKTSELGALGLAGGSMAPKAEAARRAVEAGARFAGIGRLEDAADILVWRRGTIVTSA